MKIYSVKNAPQLCEEVKLYCMKNWNKVYESFAENADKSVGADILPQTWVIKERNEEILGFYQLIFHEDITRFPDLSPFISAVYVDERARGCGCGKLILDHAKYEAAGLGFGKVYIATDHIGFYEKYGFREIGLDIYTWGRAAKLYEADTYSDIRFERYSRTNPMPDYLLLEDAKLRWGESSENPAKLLQQMKYLDVFSDNPAQSFVLTAFKNNIFAGRLSVVQNPDNRLNWYIGDLNVKKDFRRRGIAKKLLTKAIDMIKTKANGGTYIYSNIDGDNEPSRRLFASLGFIDSGEFMPFWRLEKSDERTTHILFLDNDLTVGCVKEKAHFEAVSRIYSRNIKPLHGCEISLEEWETILSASDIDEAQFLIYKGSLPAAWLKINGLENEGKGWISMLVVEPMFQGKGVGGFAVKFAEDFLRFKGKNRVSICTSKDNIAACRLYKKCGYAIAEDREFEAGDGVKRKGVVFEKNINYQRNFNNSKELY